MNEADTPNHGELFEPLTTNLLQPEQVSCPFYSVSSNSENTTVKQLPLLASAENKQCGSQIPSEENALQQDWVAEPEREKQELIDAEFKKLLELNAELRSANSDLYDQVGELKATLSESEKALQWQKKRSNVTESMLNQQTQELSAAQEQVKSLFQQLETSVQTVQRQESLLENYKAQLEISQQRLAQLERECALIQSSYNDQSHQLLQSENACRELRTRLMRQQRQTLQFKAALEKCLETPIPGYDSLEHNDTNRRQKPSHSSFLSTQAQPIRPWSAEPESLTDSVDNSWGEPVSPPHQWDNSTPNPSSTGETSDIEETSTQMQLVDTSELELETVSSDLTSLEEQLDDVIQMFFVANPVSTSSAAGCEDVDTTLASETIWETSAIPLADEPTTQKSLTHDSLEETEDYWVEISQSPAPEISATDAPQEQSIDQAINPNAPSPVLYPQRPPKRRKSLAAVELPNFRHSR